MKKRIYIAGGAGMLGKAYYDIFNQDYELEVTDIDQNESWVNYLDFRNYDEYRSQVDRFRPDFVLHLGAHTSLEYCDTNIDDCYSTNTLSVENAVQICNELDIPILYISTAGIFDGSQEIYDDWDQPNPMGHYARSKFMGERYVVENSNKYVVCRAGWMMGGGPNKDKKFINKLIKQIKNGKKTLQIVNDKLGTPTFTDDFARNSFELLTKQHWGVYNMVCDGVTGRMEVAVELLKILNNKNLTIEEVNSEYFSEEYFSPRPASERLICSKLKLRNMYLMRDWQLCLREYIERDFSDMIEH